MAGVNIPTEMPARYGFIYRVMDHGPNVPGIFIKHSLKKNGRPFDSVKIVVYPTTKIISITVNFVTPFRLLARDMIADANNNRRTLRNIILKYLNSVNINNTDFRDISIGHYCRTTLLPEAETRWAEVERTRAIEEVIPEGRDYLTEKYLAPSFITRPGRLTRRGPGDQFTVKSYEFIVRIRELNVIENEALFANLDQIYKILHYFVMKSLETVPPIAIYGLNSPNIPAGFGMNHIVPPGFVDMFLNSNRSMPYANSRENRIKRRMYPIIAEREGLLSSPNSPPTIDQLTKRLMNTAWRRKRTGGKRRRSTVRRK
jgi:hypothetical protein